MNGITRNNRLLFSSSINMAIKIKTIVSRMENMMERTPQHAPLGVSKIS